MKRLREKHMLEVKKSSVKLHFVRNSWDGPSCEILVKLSAWKIFSVTFLPFTHTTYTFITHKRKEWYIQRKKTLDRFLQHNTLTFFRESYSSLREKSLYSLLLPSPIIIPWEEICTQTQFTLIQSVESVLELRKLWGFSKRTSWGLVDAIEHIAGSIKLVKTRPREIR